MLDIVGIKRIGESQCVSSLNGYGDPLKKVHCFLRIIRFLCWSSTNFLYQLHCLIVPRSGSFNGDRIEDISGVQILIYEGLHSCCKFSCASRINGCWLDVWHRIRTENGDVSRQCFAPWPWYKRGIIWSLAILENKTRWFFVSRNFGTFHGSPDDIIDHGVALMTCAMDLLRDRPYYYWYNINNIINIIINIIIIIIIIYLFIYLQKTAGYRTLSINWSDIGLLHTWYTLVISRCIIAHSAYYSFSYT